MAVIMGPQPHKIIQIVRQTVAEFTIRVECDDNPEHGQFYQISLPMIGEAPISVSGNGPGYVEFTIRKVGSLTGQVVDLKVGNMLFMRGPYGNAFPIEEFKGKDLVVICGGTGMAPVKTTLMHFYENFDEIRSVHLIAGFKDINAVLFDEERAMFSEKFHTTYCLDNSEAPGFETGMVTKFIPDVPFAEFEDFNVAIVGPPVMMHFAAQECMKQGVPAEKIWVSFERKMSCAIGKCGHCKINETYVCLEGPVFNYTKAKELFD